MFILINNLIGLDALASAKRSQHDAGFKVPKERTISIAAYAHEEDRYELFVSKESGHDEGDMSAAMPSQLRSWLGHP